MGMTSCRQALDNQVQHVQIAAGGNLEHECDNCIPSNILADDESRCIPN